MDSTRSKQLLSQWKNRNDNRKLSLQVMDGVRPASGPASSPQRNSMELRCSSEPSAMGLEAELRAGTHLPSAAGMEMELRAGAHIPAQYMKLAASSVPLVNQQHMVQNQPHLVQNQHLLVQNQLHLVHNQPHLVHNQTLMSQNQAHLVQNQHHLVQNQHHLVQNQPHNGTSGLTGGARVSIQSRPGSSQLVHIPEEDNPAPKDQESESEDSMMDGGGSVREKWMRVAEKTTLPCRPLSAGGQPRILQVGQVIACTSVFQVIACTSVGQEIACTSFVPGDSPYLCGPGDSLYLCVPGDSLYLCGPGDNLYICLPGDSLYVCVPGDSLFICVPGDSHVQAAGFAPLAAV